MKSPDPGKTKPGKTTFKQSKFSVDLRNGIHT